MKKLNVIFFSRCSWTWTHSLSLSDSLAAEAVNHASGSAYRADTPISSPAFHLFIYLFPPLLELSARAQGWCVCACRSRRGEDNI